MKKTLRRIGQLLCCVILATAFWYLSVFLHLQWDHRRRPTRRAEVTYQTATAVFSSLERFPRWIVDATRHPSRGTFSGKERITFLQAHIIALVTYGAILYAIATAAVLLRRNWRART